MTREDTIPWVVIIALAITGAVESVHKSLASQPCVGAACGTPVSAISQSPSLMTVPSVLPPALRLPLRILGTQKNSLITQRLKALSLSQSQTIKRIEYDWKHWVELEPGMYIYQGAQFTLRNRSRVMVRDGIINVVEL